MNMQDLQKFVCGKETLSNKNQSERTFDQVGLVGNPMINPPLEDIYGFTTMSSILRTQKSCTKNGSIKTWSSNIFIRTPILSTTSQWIPFLPLFHHRLKNTLPRHRSMNKITERQYKIFVRKLIQTQEDVKSEDSQHKFCKTQSTQLIST